MQRAIVQPADLSGTALSELKQWLGITSTNEDAQLIGLLGASLDMCEGFTRQIPVEVGCEEALPIARDWAALTTAPVRAITAVELVNGNGTRSSLAAGDYEIEIAAEGQGRVRMKQPQSGRHVVVSFVAGIAADWAALPDALRHGIIRLAAHNYRDRDASEPLKPPASVAALWRPWRRLQLA